MIHPVPPGGRYRSLNTYDSLAHEPNQYISFADIPSESRYRFLLD